MEDRASLRVIGIVMAGLTAGVTLVAATLVARTVNGAGDRIDASISYPIIESRPLRAGSTT